jgi:tetratricopeptide (TPR) repeat protein
MTLLAADKYAPAAREFETVTNLNPGSYEAWSSLADLYKRLRKDDEAAKAAQKAAVLEPGTQAVKLAVLQNLKRAGRLTQAKRELKKLLQEAQNAPEFEQSLANEALQLGAYDEAIEACNNVIKAYPDSKGPLKCLLLAQYLKRQYAAAETSADKLPGADKSAEVLAIRALCRLNQGKQKEAQADLKTASAIDPSSAFVMLADGMLKMGQGDFESAADSLRFASEAYTKGSQADHVPQSLAHLSLARLNRKQGLLQEATTEAHAAGTDKRFSGPAWALEARSLLSDNARADALTAASRLLQQAQAADAEDPETLLAQSFCEMKSGKFDEARKYAGKAAPLAPADGDVNLALAMISEHENNAQAEKQELDKGLQSAANDPELLYVLGSLYLKSNKAADAVPLLKEAMDRRVKGPEICFALAEACEKSGQQGESLKYYKQSLSQGLTGESSNQAKAAINRLESGK